MITSISVLRIGSDPPISVRWAGHISVAGSRWSKQVGLDLITFDQFRFLKEGFFVRFLKTVLASQP